MKDCETCGGERTVTIDTFTPSRGHFTLEQPCPDCADEECSREEHRRSRGALRLLGGD